MRGMTEILERGKGKKYQIRFTPPGYTTRVKVSAYASREDTKRAADKIDILIRTRLNGDPPPRELHTWIANMPARMNARLVEVGLLEKRRGEAGRPTYHSDSLWSADRYAEEAAKEEEKRIRPSHVDDYHLAVKARRNNTAVHARVMAMNVLRVLRACKAELISQINSGDVQKVVSEFGVCPNTRRHYLTSCKDFTDWLRRDKRAGEDPLADVPLPLADADPTFERAPLTVEQFRALMTHMRALIAKGGKYKSTDMSRWPATDRMLVYWTAVCTGYRQNELRQLRASQLFLNDPQPAIDILAGNAKNKKRATVPIPAELAAELRAYTKHLAPAARVFSIPSRPAVISHFKRDAKAAGIPIDTMGDIEIIDFHSLRATAITWWLDIFGLSVKQVQVLARVSSPHLIARYSRRFKLAGTDWIASAPTLNSEPPKSEAMKA